MNPPRTFVGFGFGAIQAGLFLYEAEKTGVFSRLVVSEVKPDVVRAVRDSNGEYFVNIAEETGIRTARIRGVEIFDPSVEEDRLQLIDAVAESTETATAVPAVDYYASNGECGIVGILAEGLKKKTASGGPRAIIYTAENNNHAAQLLSALLDERIGHSWRNKAVCLNTVIGKMSGIVSEGDMQSMNLSPVAAGRPHAFLVEAFNRILVERPTWPDFQAGISSFEYKADLLPFEEAKLFGHNAIHSMLGFLLKRRGCAYICEAADFPDIVKLCRHAFIEEVGRALIRKYNGFDPLFTESGFREYADDLLKRMLNPYLRDSVERVTRDPRRKLGWNDRLAGAIRLAMQYDIRPCGLARGLAAAIEVVAREDKVSAVDVLNELWSEHDNSKERNKLRALAKEFLD